MPMHNISAYPEAEAISTDAFCRVEGFEHLALSFATHPMSSVRYGQRQTFAACVPLCRLTASDKKATAERHGVYGVRDNIA